MGVFLGDRLLKWYLANKRDLPWRHTRDPYKIWLSEVILQQTQVAQGLAYYNKFVAAFPKVELLAKANEDTILKMWQGLGYYSRARNLHAASKVIHSQYKDIFPKTFEEIRALKGIGNYTAAAISSMAYDLPYAVVDGNVYRVLSRVFGIKTPINSAKGIKEFQELANNILVKDKAGMYNQSIMEFGAMHCKPVNPDCQNCVLNDKCMAFAKNSVSQLPVKLKKTKIKNRYFNYFVLIDKNNKVVVNQRKGKDIWHGLFELFLIETDTETSLKILLRSKELKAFGNNFVVKDVHKKYKHILSHQHLHSDFYVLKYKTSFSKKYRTIALKDLKKPAWPRLIDKFLQVVTFS
jgi:A/G-specific adenine glycosylase